MMLIWIWAGVLPKYLSNWEGWRHKPYTCILCGSCCLWVGALMWQGVTNLQCVAQQCVFILVQFLFCGFWVQPTSWLMFGFATGLQGKESLGLCFGWILLMGSFWFAWLMIWPKINSILRDLLIPTTCVFKLSFTLKHQSSSEPWWAAMADGEGPPLLSAM